MPAHSPRSTAARCAAPLAIAVLLAVLTGCAPASEPTPSESPTPTESATPTPEPSVEPGVDDEDRAIGLSCEELVNADAVYAFNPNFGFIGEWTPDPQSDAATALDSDGIACRWVNQTSGETLDVSVANLSEDDLTALKNAAYAESEMVPTYGEEAYFEVNSGVGTAIVFDRSYWLVATSSYFLEPGEATDIINAALTALP